MFGGVTVTDEEPRSNLRQLIKVINLYLLLYGEITDGGGRVSGLWPWQGFW